MEHYSQEPAAVAPDDLSDYTDISTGSTATPGLFSTRAARSTGSSNKTGAN